ncbi:hypothetical protein ACFQZZ_18265 [Nocardia sp. GCM10030253]|uniref:hypothetical protein n=1 Tax=Nocardia sp. GCM10030253 TaxID=3273404 RepID=UPI0036396360
MRAPAVSEELLHQLHYLRTACGLPAHVDERGRLAVAIGGKVRAADMPEYWGYRVKDLLAERGLLGPVLWRPMRRLTFLTGAYPPELADNYRISFTLLKTGSAIIAPNDILILPSPDDDSRGWLCPIRDQFRPSMITVLGALVECDGRGA